jgi:hypothetical protein
MAAAGSAVFFSFSIPCGQSQPLLGARLREQEVVKPASNNNNSIPLIMFISIIHFASLRLCEQQ